MAAGMTRFLRKFPPARKPCFGSHRWFHRQACSCCRLTAAVLIGSLRYLCSDGVRDDRRVDYCTSAPPYFRLRGGARNKQIEMFKEREINPPCCGRTNQQNTPLLGGAAPLSGMRERQTCAAVATLVLPEYFLGACMSKAIHERLLSYLFCTWSTNPSRFCVPFCRHCCVCLSPAPPRRPASALPPCFPNSPIARSLSQMLLRPSMTSCPLM